MLVSVSNFPKFLKVFVKAPDQNRCTENMQIVIVSRGLNLAI